MEVATASTIPGATCLASPPRSCPCVSDTDGLEAAKPIGTDVAPVAGLSGATRVDAVVYLERDGVVVSLGVGLPGFDAADRDVAAVEAVAKLAAAKV